MRKRACRLISAFSFINLCFLFIFSGLIPVRAATESRAECIIEVTSKRFLYEKDADIRLPMASTTKILTAIIILEDCDVEEFVSVPKQAETVGGSSVYLREGEVISVKDLLYGLMLRSGNDCAVTLAVHHSGSMKAFAQIMNERAVKMGAEHSHFANPHGMPDTNHFTTAHDLAVISAYAMENEMFREIVSCQYYEARSWKNKNKMLAEYEGAVGVKTGFTIVAGRCLVTAAKRNDMTLVCVVLNSSQMYERSAELLDQTFERYSMVKLCDKQKPIEGYQFLYDFSYPLTATEQTQVNICCVVPEKHSQRSGDFVGQMKIFLQNDLIFSQNLYIV